MKKNIKQTAKNLIKSHRTKNIYKLYEYYGINIIYGNLKIKGCFFMDRNHYFVALNKNLSTKKKKLYLFMNSHILSFIRIICYIAEADKYRERMEKEAKLFVKYFKNYQLRNKKN